MGEAFEPKILAFLCNWCSYAGADLAGVSRFQYPPNIRVMRTMCSGRVDPTYILEGLKSGYDAVLVFGCHIGDCHYIDGNEYTVRRMRVVQDLLELSGIGRDRTALRWVSAAEGQIFADNVTELTQRVREQGPFNPKDFPLQMKALETVLTGPRLRWLTGIERHVTTKMNVYGDRIDPADYERVIGQAIRDEYEKALILASLGEGPLSVREMAARTALPVYTVSLKLNDLERRGAAEFRGFEGTTAKFARAV